jgi:protein-tyrosine phosphatase
VAEQIARAALTDDRRHLDWDGCFNVRDLGGLRTADGRVTRRGALVRADALERLTAAGWDALVAHGVRTVVDLRNDEEIGADAARRPAAVTTVHLPLDRIEDREFWERWSDGPVFGTPLYYRPHLDRFPGTSAAVVAAMARATPGGIAFHCAGGRDRTGMIAILVLALAGVPAETIAADYALSRERQSALYAALGRTDPTPVLDAFLADEHTTAEAEVLALLRGLDVAAHLRAGGLADADAARLRARMLEPIAAAG